MVNKVNIVFYVALLWTHLKLPAVAVTTTQLLAYLSVCGKTYFAICRLLQFSYFLKPQHSPWSLSLKRQSCFNPQYRTPLNAHPRYGIFAHFATFATLLVSRIGWSHQLFFSLAVSPCPSSIQERWMNLSEEGCNISSLVTIQRLFIRSPSDELLLLPNTSLPAAWKPSNKEIKWENGRSITYNEVWEDLRWEMIDQFRLRVGRKGPSQTKKDQICAFSMISYIEQSNFVCLMVGCK